MRLDASFEAEEPAPARRRPRDRRERIARAAARAFSARGYHAVSMESIAAEVGISAPALYRHFPNKYALFVHAATMAARALERAVGAAGAACGDPGDPARRLDAVLRALVLETIDGRRLGGLYRWERRFLEEPDRERIRRIFVGLGESVAGPLGELRPGLAPADATLLAVAALSAIGSITGHASSLPASRVEELLVGCAGALLRVELPPAPEGPAPTPARPSLALVSKKEQIIASAVEVFDRRGFHDASVEEIGAGAGIGASGLYRHFRGKADLLAAVFHRAGRRLAVETEDALRGARDAADGLERLARTYAASAFARPEILSVYFAEVGSLPREERDRLRQAQRAQIGEWVRLVVAARPAVGAVEARFLVHAALAIALDAGRLVRHDPRPEARARVVALMSAVLFGGDLAAPAFPFEPRSSP